MSIVLLGPLEVIWILYSAPDASKKYMVCTDRDGGTYRKTEVAGDTEGQDSDPPPDRDEPAQSCTIVGRTVQWSQDRSGDPEVGKTMHKQSIKNTS